jgi:O-antigen/teichoic acid export membrane protein
VLLLAGVATLRLTIAEAGAASVIPVWLSALLAVKWLQATGKSAHAERLSRDERLSVISYGWRSVASLTGLMFNSSADRLTLGLLVPASSLGIYSAAATASSPLPSLTTSIGMVRLPAVAALTGKAKSMAARQAILRSIGVLLLVSPALALVLPWVIPFVYGARYSPAVVPAEILLLGTVFSSLAAVTDDMLRAHGHPGFVTVSQGVGGAITVIGTLLVGRHSLSGVAVVSSLGYALAFTLALVRLRAAAAPPTRAGIRRSREPYLARSSSESPEKTEGHSTMRN